VREPQSAILHLGTAPDLLSPDDVATLKRNLPGILLTRSVRGEHRSPENTRELPIFCCWTAIVNPIARSGHSVCLTTGG
jgi:hypothetical protein